MLQIVGYLNSQAPAGFGTISHKVMVPVHAPPAREELGLPGRLKLLVALSALLGLAFGAGLAVLVFPEARAWTTTALLDALDALALTTFGAYSLPAPQRLALAALIGFVLFATWTIAVAFWGKRQERWLRRREAEWEERRLALEPPPADDPRRAASPESVLESYRRRHAHLDDAGQGEPEAQ